jgi:hypothetical protein
MEFAAKREMSEVCASLKSLGVWKKSISRIVIHDNHNFLSSTQQLNAKQIGLS